MNRQFTSTPVTESIPPHIKRAKSPLNLRGLSHPGNL